MIYVLLEGHEIKQDLIELFRILFQNKEIKYIERLEEYPGKGTLVKNKLFKEDQKTFTKTELYLNDRLLKESTEEIDKIKVHRDSFEKDVRVGIKKSLIDVLGSKDNNIPWGILTGIRPVKIIHDLINKDISDEEIIKVMTKEYKLNMDKTKLILDVGKKQRKYLYPLDKDKFSLYISIPFCPTRCLYCSFPSLPINKYEDYVKEYVDKLIYEIHSIGALMKGKQINTIYIGGGTPTAIPLGQLERIIQSVYNTFGEENIKEFTVEAGRPDTITEEYLQMLNVNKIHRISINPQTMNNETLKLIGRQHTSEDIIKTYKMAKDIGFKSINMDLIIGLPGEGLQEIQNTLKQIKKLDPENLTVHTLSVKRGSKFKDTIDKYPLESSQILREMLEETRLFARNEGYEPYYLYRQKQTLGNLENIGYAKEEMECIYNISMMEEKETIIGVGMGSVSKIFLADKNKIKRFPNFKGLEDYMARIDELIARRNDIINNCN